MGDDDVQLTEKLIDRLLDVYIQSNSDLQIVKSQLEIILYDYDVRPKETAIVPYGKTRNEVLMKRFAVAKAVAEIAVKQGIAKKPQIVEDGHYEG